MFTKNIRIGIIGSDSSHALAFSKLANLKDEQDRELQNVCVTAIWGMDREKTFQVAKEANIPHVVQKPEDMMEQVDAVMVVLRDGSLHCEYALPFIKAGIPTWVDKPFAIDYRQAELMVNTSREKGTILAGGSTCKYCYDVLTLQNAFKTLNSTSGVLSGYFNFPGVLNSEYGGIYFYGGHSAEILTTIFGPDVRSIKCDVHHGTLIALAKYRTFPVVINFSDAWQYYGAVYSTNKVVCREIDISFVYRLGFVKFVEAIRLGSMIESYESFLLPVRLLNALDESIQTGKEVFLDQCNGMR